MSDYAAVWVHNSGEIGGVLLCEFYSETAKAAKALAIQNGNTITADDEAALEEGNSVTFSNGTVHIGGTERYDEREHQCAT